MDLDEIKRGLRAEIKKRENEQYATFQCNVRQMCKDVLAKLEEQEVELAEKDKELNRQKYKRCLAMAKVCKLKRYDAADYRIPRRKWDFYNKWLKRWLELAEKFKEAEQYK